MPPILVFIVAAFISGLGIGGFSAHKIDSAKIDRIELALQVQKTEAQALLSSAQSRIAESEKNAIFVNQQLDKSHETAINSINTLHDSFAAVRLRDPGRRQGSHCPVPAGTGAGKSKDEADSAELSTELTGFLVDQAYHADTIAAYAAACYQFVETNCGISVPQQ